MMHAAVSDGVLEVVVDDAARGNVIDLGWVARFGSALDHLDDAVGCVLIRSEGRNFGLGGDVTTFVGDDPAGDLGRLVDGLHGVFLRLAGAGVPIVVAVQGWAAGASFSLALLADVLVVGASARFKTAYAGIGLTADGGMTWTLPRRVPRAVALDLLLTDRVLPADEAVALGVASRVVADELLVEESRAIARRIAAGSRTAHASVRRLVDDGEAATFDEQLVAERERMVAAIASPEGAEGVRAFLDRRSPDFSAAREA